MGTIVFIAALLVAVAIIAWYFQNEAKGADGSEGMLALHGAAAAVESESAGVRYRIRERVTPARRKSAAPAAQERAYRVKSAEKPGYLGDDDAEADKEY